MWPFMQAYSFQAFFTLCTCMGSYYLYMYDPLPTRLHILLHMRSYHMYVLVLATYVKYWQLMAVFNGFQIARYFSNASSEC